MKNTSINPGVVWKQFEDLLVPRLRFSVIDRAVYSYLFRHSRLEGKRQVRSTILAVARPIALEEIDFTQTKALRQAIHARERGRCFYCLRRTRPRMLCLDHVVPRAELGCNSYRNLVSSCQECNARKGDSAAADFLRWLYREGRLNSTELARRLHALEALAAGKLRPAIQSPRSYEGKELNETRRLGRTRAADLFSPVDHEATLCPAPDGPGEPLVETKSPPEGIGRA